MSLSKELKALICVVLGCLGLLFFAGCDSNSESVDEFQDTDTFEEESFEEEGEEELENPAKESLVTLLEEQEQLVEEMIWAKEMDDKEGMKQYFFEFKKLSDQYQQEFDEVVGELTPGEAYQISKRYGEIVKRIPRLR